MISRLKFILDRRVTVSNVLEKSIASYGRDFEILRYTGSLERFGVSGRSLTIGQLKSLSDRISAALVALGVERYDRVAICQRGNIEYLIYSLAIMRAGAITVPINGQLKQEDLRHYLLNTGARFVFADLERIATLDASLLTDGHLTAIVTDASQVADEGLVSLQSILPDDAADFTPQDISQHDDVMIVHTSGTTGFPKGVLHGSHSLIRATKGQLTIQPLTRANRILLASPANHHITQASIITCLASGIPAYVPAGESAEALLELIGREGCSLVLAFPDIYQGMCEAGLHRFDLSQVKSWMAGGDSSHEVHIRQLTAQGALIRLFGKRLLGSMYVEFFGTSEVGFAALLKISLPFTKRFDRYVGRPTIVSPKVKVADAQGRPLPAGVPGRLMVKGPTLFKGYWNAHDKLHGVYIDGWWWTGDVAMKTRSGGYYHLDREVDSIRSGEGRVYSLQLEERILKHPAVADVAVLELSGPDGATPGAVIECRDGQSVDRDALQRWIREQAPEHGSLRIEILPQHERLPRGLTGKVLKRQIRARYAETSVSAPIQDSIPVIHKGTSMSTAATAETTAIHDYSPGAIDFGDLPNMPEDYRAELLRLMAIQAYSEQMATTEGVEWIARAPDCKRRRVFAKIIAEEAQHSYLIYNLLERMGLPEKEAISIAEGRSQRPMHTASIEGPMSVSDEGNEWIDIMLNHVFLDRAGKFMVGNFCEASFKPWAEANKLILREERGHIGFGVAELRVYLTENADCTEIREKVSNWYARGLNFFGPPSTSRGVRLKAFGLKRKDNETLRNEFRREVEESFEELGRPDLLVLEHDAFPYRAIGQG